MFSKLDRPCWRNRVAIATVIAVLASLGYGFFERVVLFHDEIINTAKASTGHIFDYELRPLFYFLNFASVEVLGNHPLAISGMMIGFASLAGWFSFMYVR